MRASSCLVVLAALALSGCGQKRAHTVCSGGAAGPVVQGAALFELDDYGTSDPCDGADVADGTIAPLTTHTFAPGMPITWSLSPGAHTLVLRAFADSAGGSPIGSGCVEVDVAAGGDFCFDVTLTPAVVVPDDGGAGGGGAGGVDAGAPPTDLGCAPVTHFDGLGDAWYDCVPLGTQNATQAYKAANAWDASGTVTATPKMYSDNKGTVMYICDESTAKNACACWTWNATGQYGPIGRALATGGKPTQCFLPFGSTDPAWQ